MILEVAMLQVKPGLTSDFERNFQIASEIISKMEGYIHHELKRCLEDSHKYVLLVKWETLEDHTIGFRGSAEYQVWKELLHHFYDPFPVVEHFEDVYIK
ncbi:antibiotic biosynthesis monooxygenase [Paenibacillus sp. MDMC362]|uniref:antibiotic biosynthesis monooxygenase family protein n=1 Tax=Paenibacillus sp. MDMC362 TaxID=2977365 RepID=UPI000DC24B9D|nr:antibiotic biosynthesis monooxygenase [Paenibacillus sp. MDMC362]RAR45053.1 antibiotic biosynthesis monooxygenase [Paenibacillus sp. MDMC362]